MRMNVRTSDDVGTVTQGLVWLPVVAGLLLALLLAWQTGQHSQRGWESAQRWQLQLQGQHYQVGDSQLQWLKDFSEAHFAADSEQARELLGREIGVQLDAAFAQVSSRLPAFADWYYSLGGEYSRIAMAALGHLNVVEEGYVARRAASVLFPEPAWESTLVDLDGEAEQLLVTQQSHSQAAWLSELQQRLSASQVPAPISQAGDAAAAIQLDSLVSQLRALQPPTMLDSRLTLSTAGAASVAGAALWRAVSARAALKAGAAGLAARGSAAGAARVAARGASGAAGGIACLPGGPLALACAAAAAAGTWIATDWLLLQVDEALNRDEMIAGLEQGLAELQLALEAELLHAYDQRIQAWQEAANVQIERTFSPSRAR